MFVRWNFTVCWVDPELLRDLVVREPAGERLQDRELALGETERLRARALVVSAASPCPHVPLEHLA